MSAAQEEQCPNGNNECHSEANKSSQIAHDLGAGSKNHKSKYPKQNASCEYLEISKKRLSAACSPILWFKGLSSADKFTFWVAVFTGVLAIVTTIQVFTFIQSERAFLSVTGFEIQGRLTANKPIVLYFSIKNSGKRAAITRDVNVTISPYLSNPRKYEPLMASSSIAIPPGDSEINVFEAKTLDGLPRSFTETDVSAINRAKEKFFVFGYLDFEDDFSFFVGPRRVEYCFVYLPIRFEVSPGEFGGCPIGK